MADHAANSGFVQLSDKQYDTLRRFVQIVIPGLGAFYAALALLWHWGYIAEVTGTATALTVLGGVILKFARDGYEPAGTSTDVDGHVIQTDDGAVRLQLSESFSAEDLLNKKQVVFKGLNQP